MRKNVLVHTLVLLFFLNPLIVFSQRKQISIADLGAKPDGITDNTQFIQKAIDEMSRGGGIVMVPSGKFLTGVIHLKSNVELHLSEDAILLGSSKRVDYGARDASALINAKNQHHISITGKGTIDAQGEALLKDIYVMLNAGTLEDKEWKTLNPWHQMRPEERNRPKIIQIHDCDSIVVKGITLKNGLCWIQDYRNSSNICIDSIRVESNTYWNNDGIDLTDCKTASITHCFINCADDGICLKSSDRNSYCENINVDNCTVRSSASAVKIGTASWGGFKKITIHNITVYDTYRSAIAIECVDGGILEDVDVRNIKATNTGNAIFIRLGHRNKDAVVSNLRNVYIGNITAEIPKEKPDKNYPIEGSLLKYPHNVFPSSITGIAGYPVKNVTIENIDLAYEGGADQHVANFPVDSLTNVPERELDYPEFSMFGELPAWGFYVRHVDGLKLKNIRLHYKKDDFRTAVIFDAVENLEVKSLEIPTARKIPVVILNNVKIQSLENIRLSVENDKGIMVVKK
jgi:polygalacturonase